MKRSLLSFFIPVVCVAMTVCSCTKEEPKTDPDNPFGGKVFEATLTIDPSLYDDDEPATKTTSNYLGKIYWESTDTISINGVAYVSKSSGQTTTTFMKAEDAPDPEPPYEAYYPYRCYNKADNTFSLPKNVTYNSKEQNYSMPMYANDTAMQLKFKNICGILDIKLKTLASYPATVTRITVSDQWNSLSGKGKAIHREGVYNDSSTYFKLLDDTQKTTVSIDCGSGVVLGSSTKTFKHFLFPFCPNSKGYSDINIEISLTSGVSTTVSIQKKELMKNEFRRNHLYALVTTLRNPTIAPSLDKVVYYVGNGAYVKFSNGNMCYDVSSGSWGVYNYQGGLAQAAINQNPVITDGYYNANLISQFTWGYNATQSIDPTGTHTNNINLPSGNWDPATQDWGCQIPDEKGWRTLTKDEWDYLLMKRPDAAKKWGYAKYKTSTGLIRYALVIMPDSEVVGVTFVPQTLNDFTDANDWEIASSQGVVFIPMNGYRNGEAQMETSGTVGYFWTSTAAGSSDAYAMVVSTSAPPTFTPCSKGLGCNVRLVKTFKQVDDDMSGSTTQWGTEDESITVY